MEKYLERRNIRLNNQERDANAEEKTNYESNNYRSPNKQVLSFKTESKRSSSKHREDYKDVDESLNEDDPPLDFSINESKDKEFRNTNVQMPFSHRNPYK